MQCGAMIYFLPISSFISQVLGKLLYYSVLVLARVELVFFPVAAIGICFGSVLNRIDNTEIIINIKDIEPKHFLGVYVRL